MDIIIMLVILALGIAIVRGMKRGIILGIWALAIVLTIALFRYHTTSALDLSF